MNLTLQVPKPPEHGYTIIAVAGERVKQEMVSDLKYLESGSQKYEIIDRVEILKGQQIPTVLILLSTGKFLTTEDVFKAYNKSKNLNFFICEKIESSTI